MKKTYLSLILCLTAIPVYSQTWIVGDSTGLVVHVLNQNFEVDEAITFDLDCDGEADLGFYSSGPTGPLYPWFRLSFGMVDNVEVHNSNTGRVTTFTEGDTLVSDIDSMWTEYLGFIYGTGGGGQYGQARIDNKFIIFRKKNNISFNYIYILFSNSGPNFTIHKTISNCSNNPIEITENIIEQPSHEAIFCYPNPTRGLINLSREVDELKIYAVNGHLVFSVENAYKNIDLGSLKKGLYVVKITDENGSNTVKLVVN